MDMPSGCVWQRATSQQLGLASTGPPRRGVLWSAGSDSRTVRSRCFNLRLWLNQLVDAVNGSDSQKAGDWRASMLFCFVCVCLSYSHTLTSPSLPHSFSPLCFGKAGRSLSVKKNQCPVRKSSVFRKGPLASTGRVGRNHTGRTQTLVTGAVPSRSI